MKVLFMISFYINVCNGFENKIDFKYEFFINVFVMIVFYYNIKMV